MNPMQASIYNAGRKARRDRFLIESCSFSRLDENRAWWIAGWHDEDIEQCQKENVSDVGSTRYPPDQADY